MTNTIDPQLDNAVAPISGVTIAAAPELDVPRRHTPLRKRAFDIAVALPAALVTLPVTAVFAAGSAMRFKASPLFHQPRLGHGGQVFRFWKIRTLPPITPDTADKYQLHSVKRPQFANKLRRRHLDELPQLWQVVVGQMSLVGPRPEMPTLAASFDPEFVARRLSVKPGLTGLWQISTDSRRLIGEAEEWDRHYVDHHTVRLDVWIAMRTVRTMLRLDEIDSLDEIPAWTGAAPG